MKVLKLLKKFFPKTFVGIWLKNGIYQVSIKKVLPSGKINLESKEFDQEEEESKLFDFLLQIQTENIVSYIAYLDSSDFQGAIPVIQKQEYLDFADITDYKDFDDILFKEQTQSNWTLFTLQSDLIHTQNKFKTAGLDFIFSPFLFPIIAQDKYLLSKSTSIFIIADKNLTIFTIFKGDKLLFGKYVKDIDMNEVMIKESKDEIEEEKIEEFDNLNTDIESEDKFKNQTDSSFFNEEEIELDDFEDEIIETSKNNEQLDIDLLLDLDNEIKTVDGINLDKLETKPKDDIAELERFLKEDLKDEEFEHKRIQETLDINYDLVYQAIRGSVQEFYGEERFASDFIESCYILTSLKVSSSFIQKIEDDFSFDTERVRINIPELLIDLIGEELE